MILLILLVLVLLITLYVYLSWNINYWTDRGVKGPKPEVYFGSFSAAVRGKCHMGYELDANYKKYKNEVPFVGLFHGRRPIIMLTSPELVKQVLISNFKNFSENELSAKVDQQADPLFARNPFIAYGDNWKVKRNELTPAVTQARIKLIHPIVVDKASKMVNYLKSQSSLKDVDIRNLATRFTTDVISDSVFGIDANAFTAENCVVKNYTETLLGTSGFFFFYPTIVSIVPSIMKVLSVPIVPKYSATFFLDLMQQSVNLRRSDANSTRADILSYILQLQQKKDLKHVDVTAHAVSFLIEGIETTGVSIAYALYLLAKYPRTQKKLRKEIDEAYGGNEDIPFDELNELTYLDQVVNESIRFYPPIVTLGRIADTPFEVEYDGKTVVIEPGTLCQVPVYSVHHDERFYDNPEEFLPERFDEQNGGVKRYRDQCVFLPFGDGPRICIGMRLGIAQMKVALAAIIHNYELCVSDKMEKDWAFDPSNFFLVPKKGIWIDFNEL